MGGSSPPGYQQPCTAFPVLNIKWPRRCGVHAEADHGHVDQVSIEEKNSLIKKGRIHFRPSSELVSQGSYGRPELKYVRDQTGGQLWLARVLARLRCVFSAKYKICFYIWGFQHWVLYLLFAIARTSSGWF